MIRKYSGEDKNRLLNLLRLNTPQYFALSEEADFINYLGHHLEDYFVVEHKGEIIGSGGINYFIHNHEARLSWDIIHPDFQGSGIGKALTQHRINLLQNNPAVNVIYVRTTQLVYQFYQKMGFVLEKTEKDFWAPGFDLYQMKMSLIKNWCYIKYWKWNLSNPTLSFRRNLVGKLRTSFLLNDKGGCLAC